MKRKMFSCLVVLCLASLACATSTKETTSMVGSGKVVSEDRNVTGFTGISLRGSAEVEVSIGTSESVTVSADDNILPLIETRIEAGNLVIQTKPNTNITTSNPIRVVVVMKTLERVSLSGSGKIDVTRMSGKKLEVLLPGSGEISISGTADAVDISLTGSGTISCADLKAYSVSASINGSGTISVYASSSLDASISGSGTIQYAGNPADIKRTINGSGNIVPILDIEK